MARGSAPGERRGGRQAGTPNKVEREDKKLARKFGPDAIKKLAHLMEKATAENVQMGAAVALLDRAYGKASQPIGGDDDLPAIRTALEVAFVGVRRE